MLDPYEAQLVAAAREPDIIEGRRMQLVEVHGKRAESPLKLEDREAVLEAAGEHVTAVQDAVGIAAQRHGAQVSDVAKVGVDRGKGRERTAEDVVSAGPAEIEAAGEAPAQNMPLPWQGMVRAVVAADAVEPGLSRETRGGELVG
ncbi:hypothetical protein D3C72_1896660 [compost metagenome]